MTAASDSSPLSCFSRIGQLALIRAVFDEVLVPPAVWREVVTQGAGRAGARELQQAAWIHQCSIPDELATSRYLALDPGEAEAIVLAAAQDPRIAVLLDDNPARLVAHDERLVVIGNGGILVLAKKRGLIPAIRPHLNDLQSANLFLSRSVISRLLEVAEE